MQMQMEMGYKNEKKQKNRMCVYIFTFLRILMNAKRHGKKEINKYGRKR